MGCFQFAPHMDLLHWSLLSATVVMSLQAYFYARLAGKLRREFRTAMRSAAR